MDTMSQITQILKKLHRMDITTRHLVEGLVAGRHHSVFKGQGLEFSELREYRPGDDVRAIDWKVTARFNRPYIKEFIEERDLDVYFVIDVSGSGSFGTDISKRDHSLEVMATLMFGALRDNNGVGVFLVSEGIERFIPLRKGRRHIIQSLNVISAFTPESVHTDLRRSLRHVFKILKRKSLVFVISDFLDDTQFTTPLKILRRRHDVIALRIMDKREVEIPDIGLIELEDEETGEQVLVDTSDDAFRDAYARLVSKGNSEFNTSMTSSKIDAVTLFTDNDYTLPLKHLFKRRLQDGRIR